MDIQTIIATAKPILQKHKVKKAALFGSIVRGRSHKNSDIDLLINAHEGYSLFDIAGLKVELEEQLNREVDLIEYKSIRPELRDNILKHEYSFL